MMVANAQSQPITSLPVDSGASRGNQLLLPSKKRSTRDFTIAPVERSSAGTLPLLQKTKMCRPVPPNFLPCGAQNAAQQRPRVASAPRRNLCAGDGRVHFPCLQDLQGSQAPQPEWARRLNLPSSVLQARVPQSAAHSDWRSHWHCHGQRRSGGCRRSSE